MTTGNTHDNTDSMLAVREAEVIALRAEVQRLKGNDAELRGHLRGLSEYAEPGLREYEGTAGAMLAHLAARLRELAVLP